MSGFGDLSFDSTCGVNENAEAAWSWGRQSERAAACYELSRSKATLIDAPVPRSGLALCRAGQR